jgi:hypothetical protein
MPETRGRPMVRSRNEWAQRLRTDDPRGQLQIALYNVLDGQ